MKWHDWYKWYLLGPRWAQIRQRVMNRDEGYCVLCDSAADCVHHRSYGILVLEGYDDDELFSLCNECHDAIHINNTGGKRTSAQARSVLDEALKSRA